MGRHERRADLRFFRSEVHKAHLVTYLFAADTSLVHQPLLRDELLAARQLGSFPHGRPGPSRLEDRQHSCDGRACWPVLLANDASRIGTRRAVVVWRKCV